MAGTTNLNIHRGDTKKLRIQASAPTDPSPATGDVYIDNSAGYEAIGFYNVSGWIYVSLQS